MAAASDPAPEAPAAPRRWRRLLYVPAVLAWLAFSIGAAAEGSESGAETAGRIFGALALPLAVALLLRLLYVKVLVRSRRRPFLSPWIFVIAAAVGLLATIGRISERESDPRRQEARALVEGASGSDSTDVVDCVEGALDAYDGRSGAALPFSRPQAGRILVRFCQTAEREGLTRRAAVSEPRMTALMEQVLRDMRARGELPRA